MPLSKKLIEAVQKGNIPAITEYLNNGGNINELNEEGQGGLLHGAVANHQNELAKFLLANGADPNLRGKKNPVHHLYEYTPIHRAARFGNVEGIKLLLNYKVNLETRDLRLYTPLHHAVEGGKKESVEFLLSKGADVNARAFSGLTPFHLLIVEKSIDQQVKLAIAEVLIYTGKADLDVSILLIQSGSEIFTSTNTPSLGGTYSLKQFAMIYCEYQIVALLEKVQRSGHQIQHTTQSQLLQAVELLTNKISSLEKKLNQMSLIEDEIKKPSNEDKDNNQSFFGFSRNSTNE